MSLSYFSLVTVSFFSESLGTIKPSLPRNVDLVTVGVAAYRCQLWFVNHEILPADSPGRAYSLITSHLSIYRRLRTLLTSFDNTELGTTV